MTKRLVMTPAIGLFAGLSVVSYGALNVLLSGVHGIRQASTNPCASATATPTATATTKALVRRSAQHPASMPVLLAHVAAASSASPSPSTQPSASASPPPLPQPSPGTSASPGASTLPQPAPATSLSTAPVQPGGTLKSPVATATPTTTPTPTGTPTTTPTTTPTPPTATLCMQIQTLNNVSAVDPHTTVGYAIWVWLTSGTGGTAKVTLSAKPSSVRPTFSVCALPGGSKCTVSGLNAGQRVQLQAELAAPNRPAKRVTLTATATSSQAVNSATASATVDIKPKNTPAPTPNPSAGDGGVLPPPAGLPSGTTIPGVGSQPTGDLGSAFPQVSPSAAGAGRGTARHGHTARTIDLSAGLPLTVRLIGGQIIGLAILAAAVTIAVARLSLRRQPARHGEDGPGT